VFGDNGTNFQGGDNPLLDPGMLLKTKEQSEWVQVHPSNYLYEWKFTPPFGGLCEAIIKSTKTSVCTSGDKKNNSLY
jgi:hypothetical protein